MLIGSHIATLRLFHPHCHSLCVLGEEAASTPGLLDSAVDYVKIRAFSMPTSLVSTFREVGISFLQLSFF